MTSSRHQDGIPVRFTGRSPARSTPTSASTRSGITSAITGSATRACASITWCFRANLPRRSETQMSRGGSVIVHTRAIKLRHGSISTSPSKGHPLGAHRIQRSDRRVGEDLQLGGESAPVAQKGVRRRPPQSRQLNSPPPSAAASGPRTMVVPTRVRRPDSQPAAIRPALLAARRCMCDPASDGRPYERVGGSVGAWCRGYSSR